MLTVPNLMVQTNFFCMKIYLTLFKPNDFLNNVCRSQNAREDCV